MKICAVIVTYNRLDKLKKTLDAYDKQTRTVDKIIVVDNASKEDTKEYLKTWQSSESKTQKVVVTLDTNMGGSGGFYYGMKKAKEIGFDYLFIADDDAYPEESAFEKIENAINKYHVEALCTRVTEPKGINLQHRRRTYRKHLRHKEIGYDISNYEKEYFECELFSFVGAVISNKVVEKCGYPNKDYFIWFDDTEYAYRVKENFKILCIPSINVFHDCDESNSGEISWKQYYGFRNTLDCYSKHVGIWDVFTKILATRIKNIYRFFKNKPVYKLYKTAIHDYKHHKFGISEVYKPGTKIK